MKLLRPIENWASRPYDEGRDTLHRDIFCSACLLLEEGHTQDQIFAVMRRAANVVSDRQVPDRELVSAIECAASYLSSGLKLEGVRWPAKEPVYFGEVITANWGVAGELIEAARTRSSLSPLDMLRLIYRPESLLCIGFEARVFATGSMPEIEEWIKIRGIEFITPSPASKREGITKEGKVSPHCEDATGPKMFQVIEFDSGDPRQHVACHLHLARQMPLMMLVYSGGKSIHGWYRVTPDTDLRAFFYDASLLGGDHVMWSRAQFSRLPEGINTLHNRKQSVLYFDKRFTLNTPLL